MEPQINANEREFNSYCCVGEELAARKLKKHKEF